MQSKKLYFVFTLLFLLFFCSASSADRVLKIGFVGSLSGFAGSYGDAVLKGANLAVEELGTYGTKIELIVEDDHSSAKDTATAFAKLRTVDHVQGVIGGSWWINSIAKQAETYQIPILSCETLFNKSFIKARGYFSLGGDLRRWVNIYDSLISSKGLKTAVTVKSTSGFGETIAEEMQKLFSKDGRKYLGHIEYSDLDMADAPALAVKVKRLNPQVVYVDGQPASFASFIKRLNELGLKDVTILTNSIADDAIKQKLFDINSVNGRLYFTKREAYYFAFAEKYLEKYGVQPTLSADLGYYAVMIFAQAFKPPVDPVAEILRGEISVDLQHFKFDENNVWEGVFQEIWTVVDGKVEKVELK